jgi:hypothetical protein
MFTTSVLLFLSLNIGSKFAVSCRMLFFLPRRLLATVAGLLIFLCNGRCQGNMHEPATRLMVFRDVPKGMDLAQPQHLVVRTSFPVSERKKDRMHLMYE